MDAESRATQLEAQKGLVRDGIELEVMQAWQGVICALIVISVCPKILHIVRNVRAR